MTKNCHSRASGNPSRFGCRITSGMTSLTRHLVFLPVKVKIPDTIFLFLLNNISELSETVFLFWHKYPIFLDKKLLPSSFGPSPVIL
jgi:hypothetical protein